MEKEIFENNIYFTEPEMRVLLNMIQYNIDCNLMHEEAVVLFNSIKEKICKLQSKNNNNN